MKVLIISPVEGGGICHYTYSFCRSLYEKGIDLLLLTAKNNTEIDYFNPQFKIEKILFPYTRSFFARTWHGYLNRKKIKKIVQQKNPQVAHFHWTLTPQLDIKLIKFLKSKNILTIFTAHVLLPHEVKAKDKKNYQKLYQVFDKIIVHAQANKKEMVNLFDLAVEKITFIPQGNFFAISNLNPNLSSMEARQLIGTEPHSFNVLFFGNLRPYRGLDTLLKAMVYLKDLKKIKLIIACHSKYSIPFCEDLVDLLRIRDQVQIFMDYIPLKYIGQYFYASDVVVLPYRYVYQSGAVHLAYAFARPVISTKVGGIAEIVDNGKSGLLVNPSDPKMLAEAILKMYNAPSDKIREMGKFAYHLAKTEFAWDKIADKTIEVYKKGI